MCLCFLLYDIFLFYEYFCLLNVQNNDCFLVNLILLIKKLWILNLRKILDIISWLWLQVGWEVKHVMGLFAECPTEVLLTLKKRPRHTKVYGQIYVKPYRLPSKKRSPHPFSTRHLHLTPLRIHLQPLNK